jgi:hypothetical protein
MFQLSDGDLKRRLYLRPVLKGRGVLLVCSKCSGQPKDHGSGGWCLFQPTCFTVPITIRKAKALLTCSPKVGPAET